MGKTAVLIYDGFSNFEISVALEILALNNKEIVIFSKNKKVVRSEERINVIPDKDINEIEVDDFDSLLLPGAVDIRNIIEDEQIKEFISKFEYKIIGAISIAPILLLKAGILKDKKFMAGVNKEELYDEGFTFNELIKMKDWNDCVELRSEMEYIIDGNIITSVAFNFVKFGIQFCKMLGYEANENDFEMLIK